jgi:hypothetical protein
MADGKSTLTLQIAGTMKGKKHTRTIKTGLWSDLRGVHIDGRSRLGKWMNHLRGELIKHCGGEPSVAESILIEQIVIKTLKSHLYHVGLFKDKSFGSKDHALAIQNSIRLDLMALGLQNRAKNVTTLEAYLESKAEGVHSCSPLSSDPGPETVP